MKRAWVLTALAACCTIATVLTGYYLPRSSRVLIVQDAFDPMVGLLEPYIDHPVETMSPYVLAHQLPDLKGMAFIFSTQARHLAEHKSQAGFEPLVSADVVIAVNQQGSAVGQINGWHSLLSSSAAVLIPDQGTEYGRLAAIALSGGLGAQPGDFTPALNAYRNLADQGRLNPKDEYASPVYRNMYQPQRPDAFDAVVMMDYQARKLARDTEHWDIIVPVEGTVTVQIGYYYAGSAGDLASLQSTRDFLASDAGQQMLADAGYLPLKEATDISGWQKSRLLFNPMFRRSVRGDKLYAPASVRERLMQKSILLLLFSLAAQFIIRRIPQGQRRRLYSAALLTTISWMLTGLMKATALQPELARQFWFASYWARHLLPVFWYFMCFIQVHNRLPARRSRGFVLLFAIMLTLFIAGNDWHRQVFIYQQADQRTWEHVYLHGWGFYLSLTWSFLFILAGFMQLIRGRPTRQQKHQYLYASLFIALLLAYQLAYILGVTVVIDLDIPTMVSLFIMVFILVIHHERFMGAALLSLPVFQHTPHGIAIYDQAGVRTFTNQIMDTVASSSHFDLSEKHSHAFNNSGKYYQPHYLTLKQGNAVVLEDISELENFTTLLAEKNRKLNAVHNLLIHREKIRPDTSSCPDRDNCGQLIQMLFKRKVDDACQMLQTIKTEGQTSEINVVRLKHMRFLITLCQMRLRFALRVLSSYPDITLEQLNSYINAIAEKGRQIGLDIAFHASGHDRFRSETLVDMLDVLDRLCLTLLAHNGLSLVIHVQVKESSIVLAGFFEQALSNKDVQNRISLLADLLPKDLPILAGKHITYEQAVQEEGLSLKIMFPGYSNGR